MKKQNDKSRREFLELSSVFGLTLAFGSGMDGEHFTLDTAGDEIVLLAQNFMKQKR